MAAIATPYPRIKPPKPEPDRQRCEQCGELLDPKRLQSRPIRCIDCAYDQLPCTD